MRSLEKSNLQFRKAVTKLPLGVSSNFRYWGEDKTIYVKRAKGARLWDIDDNEYIDYRLAYGPAILGYADPRVDEAAGFEKGTFRSSGRRLDDGEQQDTDAEQQWNHLHQPTCGIGNHRRRQFM